MLHNTLSIAELKLCKLHVSIKTIHHHIWQHDQTYNTDTNKATKDDKHLWLNKEGKRWNMTDRKIIERKILLQEPKLTKEKQAKVHDLKEEQCEAFCSCYEIGTCPVRGTFKKAWTLLSICPYEIKEEEKPVIKDLSQLWTFYTNLVYTSSKTASTDGTKPKRGYSLKAANTLAIIHHKYKKL